MPVQALWQVQILRNPKIKPRRLSTCTFTSSDIKSQYKFNTALDMLVILLVCSKTEPTTKDLKQYQQTVDSFHYGRRLS